MTDDDPSAGFLPTSFRQSVASTKQLLRASDGRDVQLSATLYRPFRAAPFESLSSYRVRLDGKVVAEGSGPGTDRVVAVFLGTAMLARALKLVITANGLSVFGHDFWWIASVLNEPDTIPRIPISDEE